MKVVFITVFCPSVSGFLAYQYLERYGPNGIVKSITKIILGYCIIEVGLATGFALLTTFHL
ncbi:MAG: hypothetical protein ACM3IJ_05935 [Candidatus Levyibacteriota bacterium]